MKKRAELCTFFILAVLFLPQVSFAAAKEKPVSLETLPTDPSMEDEQQGTGYVIGPSNLLQIKIFGEANINQLYRVDDDGYIKHALGGRVHVGGLTVSEAERLLEKKLDGD